MTIIRIKVFVEMSDLNIYLLIIDQVTLNSEVDFVQIETDDSF